MDHRLILVALLAFTGFQVIEGGRYDGGVTTTNSESTEDEDSPVSILIPLPQSYNMTTQWLGLLRSSFLEILSFERTQRMQNSRQVATDVRLLSNSYREEMDALVVKIVDKNRSCVEKNTEPGLQVLSTIDEELHSCTHPLIDMIHKYDETLDKTWTKVSNQNEEKIYAKCLPSESILTTKILERSEKCFRTEYKAAVDSFYYQTGHHLFSTVTQMAMTLAQLEGTAMSCGLGVLDAHDKVMTEKLEGIRQCATRVALPGYAPHSRVRRGFGKKLKKAWKKIRNGAKKLCSKIPCKVGYSVALPGK